MRDANLELYTNANLTTDLNTYSENGTDLVIGKAGLHRNAQVVASVQSAGAIHDLHFDIYMSLNADEHRLVGSIVFAKGFAGQQTLGLSRQVAWQEYVEGEVELRCVVHLENDTNGS